MSNDPTMEMLARLLYGENRQDLTPDEAAAIVDVVQNRAADPRWPASVQEVLTQPNQFQPFSPRGAAASQTNANITGAFGEGDPRWNEYMTFAQYGMQNLGRKRTPFTHYWSGEQTPAWAAKLKNVTKIGRHTFGVDPAPKRKKAKAKAKR